MTQDDPRRYTARVQHLHSDYPERWQAPEGTNDLVIYGHWTEAQFAREFPRADLRRCLYQPGTDSNNWSIQVMAEDAVEGRATALYFLANELDPDADLDPDPARCRGIDQLELPILADLIYLQSEYADYFDEPGMFTDSIRQEILSLANEFNITLDKLMLP